MSELIAGLLALYKREIPWGFHMANDGWGGFDKVQHFTISFGLVYLGYAIYNNFWFALIFALFPGFLKEGLDSREEGSGLSYRDQFFNLLGVFAGFYCHFQYLPYSFGSLFN